MQISDKAKKITCLVVAISLIVPLAISIVAMFVSK